MIEQISDSELELMKIVWASGGKAKYTDIMEALAKKGNSWQKNTVITLLSRLADKGMLKTSKIGRRNEYIALISESDYQSTQARTLLNKLYAGDAKGLVATLIQGEMLSEEDYQELKRFWDNGGGGK